MSHRGALWALLLAKVVGAWGLTWDIEWHITIGRDSFWIAPHVMIYSSVAAAFVVAFGVLLRDTRRGAGPRAIRALGLTGSRGFHLAAWGVMLVVLAAPIDDLWHRLFGIDVTLWSPPHLLALFGSAVNTLGCAVIATEVYPAGRARLAALLLAGGLFYGGVRVALEPAWPLAYVHGGVAFHLFAILAAVALPVALLPAVRLTALRWAPVLVVAVALAVTAAGDGIARAGFAQLQPESAVAEAIAQDPTSPIARAAEIRAKNGAPRAPLWSRLLLPLVPAGLMALVDPRRRPRGATVAYGVSVLAVYGGYLAGRPAFAPLVPSTPETLAALALVVAGALAGRALGDRLAAAIEPGGARPAPRAVPQGAWGA